MGRPPPHCDLFPPLTNLDRAIGMAHYGHEIMQSYGALVKDEFREKYQLPISLGMFKIDAERERRGQYDDLTVVSSIIEKKHKDPMPYHPPQVCPVPLSPTSPSGAHYACGSSSLDGCTSSRPSCAGGGAGTVVFGATSTSARRRSPGCSGARYSPSSSVSAPLSRPSPLCGRSSSPSPEPRDSVSVYAAPSVTWSSLARSCGGYPLFLERLPLCSVLLLDVADMLAHTVVMPPWRSWSGAPVPYGALVLNMDV